METIGKVRSFGAWGRGSQAATGFGGLGCFSSRVSGVLGYLKIRPLAFRVRLFES